MEYKVFVSNVGCLHEGTDKAKAHQAFEGFCGESKDHNNGLFAQTILFLENDKITQKFVIPLK